jgi:Raf kinase inhibitor-like YbhB/YbcL family protein
MAAVAIPAGSFARSAPDARSRGVAGRAPEISLQLTSDAFVANQAIPSEYTCDGAWTTPPLTWSKAPPTTRSVAILMEDPDAPGGAFLHWLVTGIDPTSMFLPPSMLPPGAVVSKNDKGEKGYFAPCATDGGHRYVFHVYALDTALPAEVVKDVFLGSIEGHILAHGTLIGTYGRPDPSRTVGDVKSDARQRSKAPTPKS